MIAFTWQQTFQCSEILGCPTCAVKLVSKGDADVTTVAVADVNGKNPPALLCQVRRHCYLRQTFQQSPQRI